MATATASASASATLSPLAASIGSPRKAAPRRVHYLPGMNSFAGLKASNGVVSLGLPVSAEQSFARIVSSLRAPSGSGRGRAGSGGASSTCNAAAEIFRIAAIINGLVLVGVAVGFALLRMEAFVEESEA